MDDPLNFLPTQLQAFEHRILTAAEIRVLRGHARMVLSRLVTLDQDRAASYESAISTVGEGG